MEDQEILDTISAVRMARLHLLSKPGALDELRHAIERVDSQETRKVLRTMLADDLRQMRRMGLPIWRRGALQPQELSAGNETVVS